MYGKMVKLGHRAYFLATLKQLHGKTTGNTLAIHLTITLKIKSKKGRHSSALLFFLN
jgi:hypothetical protein